MKNKILITKDILRVDYLPLYGNKFWKTQNIDELANKGTVFNRHYAAGTSTAMSVTSMFTGKNSFEVKRKKYEEVEEYNEGETLFSELNKAGYRTYVIWPFEWKELAWKYSKVFPKQTKVYPLKNIMQRIGKNEDSILTIDEEKAIMALNEVIDKLSKILDKSDKTFIWLHLPHVISGRSGYGSDIDVFDALIGEIRKLIPDDSIYISADHGHMNLSKTIPVYGFHPYEGTIKIPLITPRIKNRKTVDFPTSNTQLKDIILNDHIEKLPYVYSDTQYYLQENRKLAVIKDNYKYIYNKRNRTEELYDVDFDPNEKANLLIEDWFDRNRLCYYKTSEIYYYPYWDKVEAVYLELKAEKDRIWREGSFIMETAYKLNNFRKKGLKNFYNRFKGGMIRKGKFGAKIKNLKYGL